MVGGRLCGRAGMVEKIRLLNQNQTIVVFFLLPAKTGQTVVSQETSREKSNLKN